MITGRKDMKRYRKTTLYFLTACLLLILLSTNSFAANIKLSKKKITLQWKKTYQLKVSGTNDKIVWKSSNPKIVSVSQKGKITAKKVGEAVVTARVKGKKFACRVKVIGFLNKTKLNISVGKKFRLILRGSRILTVKSSSPTVASISKNGIIRARKAGYTSIKVTDQYGNQYTCKVKVLKAVVTPAPVTPLSNEEKISIVDSSLKDVLKQVNSNGGNTRTQVLKQLQTLADRDMIKPGYHYDKDSDTIEFEYSDGSLGGVIMYSVYNDQAGSDKNVIDFSISKLTGSKNNIGKAVVFYDFDAESYQSRFPNYTRYKQEWSSSGLDTLIIQDSTVNTIKNNIGNYDIVIISMHGAYFANQPVLCLQEVSTDDKDKTYRSMLQEQYIVKVFYSGDDCNLHYCIMPKFFSSAKRMDGAIVFSESCDFMGYERPGAVERISNDLSNAILKSGADTVVGFHNSVTSIYSRNILKSFVDNLILGQTAVEALSNSKKKYGDNDGWRVIETGKNYAYPILQGEGGKRLVSAVEATGISLSHSNISINESEGFTLTATVSPGNATNKTVTWSSSNTNVATVNNGKVIGKTAGTATITATTNNGKTASCTVKVVKPVVAVTGLSLNANNITIDTGKTYTLKATVSPGNATNKTVIWSSSNTNVATVNSGKVTGKTAGTATITATTNNGKTASCTVKVVKPVVAVTGISLNANNITIDTEKTYTLKATVSPDNATNKAVTWSSSNTNVATVNDGKVTGKAAGTTTITATTNNNKTVICNVTVVDPLAVTLGISSVEMEVGDYCGLVPWFDPDEKSIDTIFWRSSDSSIASVDSQGVICAINPGTAIITAYADNCKSANCNVTVKKISNKGNYSVGQSDALKVYNELLTSNDEGWLFSIIYLTNDNIPDLAYLMSDENYTVYRVKCNGGVVHSPGNSFNTSYFPRTSVTKDTYIKYSGRYYSYNTVEYEIDCLYQLRGEYLKGFSDLQEHLSKNEFDYILKSWIGNTQEQPIVFHPNTVENRKYYLSGRN